MADFPRRALETTIGCLGVAALGVAMLGDARAADLEVRYLDVGQADAALIRCPDGEHRMLIDAADTRYPGSTTAFKDALQAEFQGEPQPWALDVVVASHPHADHIGSMLWVLETFDVETYVDNGQQGDTATFGRVNAERRRQVEAGELTYVPGKTSHGTELTLCPDHDVTVKVLVPWALDATLSDTNDRSVVIRLDFGECSFLFVGDAHDDAEAVMVAAFPDDLDVDVLKVGHHGSHTSSSDDFIEQVSPDVAVVSSGKPGVGTNSRYKHPRYRTVGRYARWFKSLSPPHPLEGDRVRAYDEDEERWRQHQRRTGLWLTPVDGTLTLTCDGQDVTVTPER